MDGGPGKKRKNDDADTQRQMITRLSGRASLSWSAGSPSQGGSSSSSAGDLPDLSGMDDEQLRKHVDFLCTSSSVKSISEAQTFVGQGVIHESTTKRRFFFFELHQKLQTRLLLLTSTATQTESAKNYSCLGWSIRGLGFGSSAGRHKSQVDKVIKSCAGNENHLKGAMLSHSFYRSFFRHAFNPATTDDRDLAGRFSERCASIWKETDFGVVRRKNQGGCTPEPAATSLLATFINQLFPSILGEGITAAWASEYPLHWQDWQDDKAKPKYPRTDGLLVAADPLNGGALRPLVSMEARLDTFGDQDIYESRSNACDAFAQKPDNSAPWPLLLFRLTLSRTGSANVAAHALVPTSRAEAMEAPLWESSEKTAVFDAVVAALRATKDFISVLEKGSRQMDFCPFSNNVAVQETDSIVYKSFYNTSHRRSNLKLVQEFVDEDAVEIVLGEMGSYIKMKWVGRLFSENYECGSLRFVEIASELTRLHRTGNCHGDIRVSNLILGAEPAKIIDFDLSGPSGTHKYPNTLVELFDGQRHPDVSSAIENSKVNDLCLEEAHDWHSLQAAMRCFNPKEKQDEEAWLYLISNIQGHEGATLNDLKLDFPLVLNEEVAATAR